MDQDQIRKPNTMDIPSQFLSGKADDEGDIEFIKETGLAEFRLSYPETKQYPELADRDLANLQFEARQAFDRGDMSEAVRLYEIFDSRVDNWWPSKTLLYIARTHVFGDGPEDRRQRELLLNAIAGIQQEINGLRRPAETTSPVSQRALRLQQSAIYQNLGASLYRAAELANWEASSVMNAANAFVSAASILENENTNEDWLKNAVSYGYLRAADCHVHSGQTDLAAQYLKRSEQSSPQFCVSFLQSRQYLQKTNEFFRQTKSQISESQ